MLRDSLTPNVTVNNTNATIFCPKLQEQGKYDFQIPINEDSSDKFKDQILDKIHVQVENSRPNLHHRPNSQSPLRTPVFLPHTPSPLDKCNLKIEIQKYPSLPRDDVLIFTQVNSDSNNLTSVLGGLKHASALIQGQCPYRFSASQNLKIANGPNFKSSNDSPEFSLKMKAVNPIFSPKENSKEPKLNLKKEKPAENSAEKNRLLFRIPEKKKNSYSSNINQSPCIFKNEICPLVSLTHRESNPHPQQFLLPSKKVKTSLKHPNFSIQTENRPVAFNSNDQLDLEQRHPYFLPQMKPTPSLQLEQPRQIRPLDPIETRLSRIEIPKSDKHLILSSPDSWDKCPLRFSTPVKSNRKHNSIGDLSIDQIINEKFQEVNGWDSPSNNPFIELDYYGAQKSPESKIIFPNKSRLVFPEEIPRLKELACQIEEDTFLKMTGAQNSPSVLLTNCSPDFREKFKNFFSNEISDENELGCSPDLLKFSKIRSKSCQIISNQELEILRCKNITQNLTGKLSLSRISSIPKYNTSSSILDIEIPKIVDQPTHVCNGDFGMIYRFLNPSDQQEYALKVLNKNLENALREAQLMGYIRSHCPSKYIVGYYTSWSEQNSVKILLESCVCSVEQHFANHPELLCEASLLTLLKHVAKALKTLHAEHIIHLDLKPANILLSHNQDYKLCDFGNARLLTKMQDIMEMDEGDFRFMPQECPGTVSWEQIQSGAVDLTKVDIYSLGMTLLELALCKEMKTRSVEEIEAVRSGNLKVVDCLTEFSNFFKSILKSMLSADSRMRPSAAQILKELKVSIF